MQSAPGTFRNGQVQLNAHVDWPDGTSLRVTPAEEPSTATVSQTEALDDWPDGYFEETAGALRGERFERAPQGELPSREDW